MSFLLYTRWPDFDFCGARFGNSVSQNRRTKASISTILHTSPMRKKSLSGISVIKQIESSHKKAQKSQKDFFVFLVPLCGQLPSSRRGGLHALLDYNGGPG